MLKDNQFEVYLPTELASLFINGDPSILDYIDDEDYSTVIANYADELENDRLRVIDVLDDSSFCSYHDMTEYGVLPTNCSTFILESY